MDEMRPGGLCYERQILPTVWGLRDAWGAVCVWRVMGNASGGQSVRRLGLGEGFRMMSFLREVACACSPRLRGEHRLGR